MVSSEEEGSVSRTDCIIEPNCRLVAHVLRAELRSSRSVLAAFIDIYRQAEISRFVWCVVLMVLLKRDFDISAAMIAVLLNPKTKFFVQNFNLIISKTSLLAGNLDLTF